jgi:hypothetical protein
MSRRVLVVDDEKGVREALKQVLEFEDIEVQTCASGLDALQAYAEFRPHLVFLDVKMQGMDGLEVLKRLREHDAHAHQPPDPDTGPDPGYDPGPPPDHPDATCPTCGHAAGQDPRRDPGDASGRAPGESSAHSQASQQPRPPTGPDLPAGARIDPAKLRPKAVLHLHGRISDFRTGQGSFRLEHDTGVGLSHAEMVDLLGHAHVTVRPVIDLNHQVPVDAHEVPAELAEAARQLHPYTVSPFSTTRSRGKHVDDDHTERYVPDPDQPGQTRLDNLGPLGRGGHRYKTFARGVTVAQPTLGVLVWRTRHGFCFQVDQHGTHPLGKMTATQFHALVTELALEDTDQLDDEDLAG